MTAPEDDPCDHDWEFVDASFDHAFGTEIDQFMRCEKCDEQRECDPSDFYHEDYE